MVIDYWRFEIANLTDREVVGTRRRGGAKKRGTGSEEWLLIIGDSKLQI
jgi:hypothetical protein